MVKDKVILLTGASSGIGEATAQRLAHAGAKLMLVARREERLKTLVASLGKNVAYTVADVTNVQTLQQAVDNTIQAFGKLDVLVNNAGMGHLGPMKDAALWEWHQMVEVNIKGVLNGIHIALPHLIQSNGHIINVSSIAAHEVFPNAVVYCATKYAVNALMIGFRKEFREQVRITNISPGTVATEFAEQFANEQQKEQMRDYYAAGLHPDAVAEAIEDVLERPPQVVINEIILRPSSPTSIR